NGFFVFGWNFQLRAARIDQHAAGLVLDKKRREDGLFSVAFGVFFFAAIPGVPGFNAIVVTVHLGQGRNQRVRSGSSAEKLYPSHRRGRDSADRRVLDAPFSLAPNKT